MKRRVKRCLFWLLLSVALAAAVRWILYFPYDPALLYHAVPGHAVLVSDHDGLAARWPQLAGHPVVRRVAESLGADSAKLEGWSSDRGLQALLDRFAGRRTVVAYVPSFGRMGDPAWVAATWAGGYAQLLRWGVLRGLLKDFRPVRMGGHRVWKLEPSDPDSPLRLSVASVEGCVVACYSADPRGVVSLIDRIEHRAPIAGELHRALLLKPQDGDTPPDRAWVRLPPPVAGYASDPAVGVALTGTTGGVLQGWLDCRIELPEAEALGGGERTQKLRRLTGTSPSTLLVLPAGSAEAALRFMDATAAGSLVADFIGEHARDGGHAFAGLCAGDCSGRILGLRVPGVVFGVETSAQRPLENLVTEILDVLNSRFGWGVISRRVAAPGWEGLAVDSTRFGMFSGLGLEDRPVFALHDGWLVLGSNQAALSALLAGEDARRLDANGIWSRIEHAEKAQALLWTDLRATVEALDHAFAVYKLVLMVQGGASAAAARERVETVQRFLETALPVEECLLRLETRGRRTRVHFRLGVPPGDGPPVAENP